MTPSNSASRSQSDSQYNSGTHSQTKSNSRTQSQTRSVSRTRTQSKTPTRTITRTRSASASPSSSSSPSSSLTPTQGSSQSASQSVSQSVSASQSPSATGFPQQIVFDNTAMGSAALVTAAAPLLLRDRRLASPGQRRRLDVYETRPLGPDAWHAITFYFPESDPSCGPGSYALSSLVLPLSVANVSVLEPGDELAVQLYPAFSAGPGMGVPGTDHALIAAAAFALSPLTATPSYVSLDLPVSWTIDVTMQGRWYTLVLLVEAAGGSVNNSGPTVNWHSADDGDAVHTPIQGFAETTGAFISADAGGSWAQEASYAGVQLTGRKTACSPTPSRTATRTASRTRTPSSTRSPSRRPSRSRTPSHSSSASASASSSASASVSAAAPDAGPTLTIGGGLLTPTQVIILQSVTVLVGVVLLFGLCILIYVTCTSCRRRRREKAAALLEAEHGSAAAGRCEEGFAPVAIDSSDAPEERESVLAADEAVLAMFAPSQQGTSRSSEGGTARTFVGSARSAAVQSAQATPAPPKVSVPPLLLAHAASEVDAFGATHVEEEGEDDDEGDTAAAAASPAEADKSASTIVSAPSAHAVLPPSAQASMLPPASPDVPVVPAAVLPGSTGVLPEPLDLSAMGPARPQQRGARRGSDSLLDVVAGSVRELPAAGIGATRRKSSIQMSASTIIAAQRMSQGQGPANAGAAAPLVSNAWGSSLGMRRQEQQQQGAQSLPPHAQPLHSTAAGQWAAAIANSTRAPVPVSPAAGPPPQGVWQRRASLGAAPIVAVVAPSVRVLPAAAAAADAQLGRRASLGGDGGAGPSPAEAVAAFQRQRRASLGGGGGAGPLPVEAVAAFQRQRRASLGGGAPTTSPFGLNTWGRAAGAGTGALPPHVVPGAPSLRVVPEVGGALKDDGDSAEEVRAAATVQRVQKR